MYAKFFTNEENRILKNLDPNTIICDVGCGKIRCAPSAINVDLIVTTKILEHVRNPRIVT